MRNVRACATDGARLTPSAPSAPTAAETPPESLTKSRRDRPPAGLDAAEAAGGGTDAAIRPETPSLMTRACPRATPILRSRARDCIVAWERRHRLAATRFTLSATFRRPIWQT